MFSDRDPCTRRRRCTREEKVPKWGVFMWKEYFLVLFVLHVKVAVWNLQSTLPSLPALGCRKEGAVGFEVVQRRPDKNTFSVYPCWHMDRNIIPCWYRCCPACLQVVHNAYYIPLWIANNAISMNYNSFIVFVYNTCYVIDEISF